MLMKDILFNNSFEIAVKIVCILHVILICDISCEFYAFAQYFPEDSLLLGRFLFYFFGVLKQDLNVLSEVIFVFE